MKNQITTEQDSIKQKAMEESITRVRELFEVNPNDAIIISGDKLVCVDSEKLGGFFIEKFGAVPWK